MINFAEIKSDVLFIRGYWRRLGCPSVRPSGCPHFVSGAELGNPCMDFFNFRHTHSLGGVDVPFGVFEILPA